MTRSHGRCRRGQRLIDKTPHGHWKTTTLIGALDCRGMRCSTVVDGAVNLDVFEAFVEQVLLKQLKPGDIVVMDNLSSHKSERIVELIESVGADVRYLPPYSPDLNPVERLWAYLRSHYLSNRAYDDYQHLLDAGAQAWQQLTPDVLRTVCACPYLEREIGR